MNTRTLLNAVGIVATTAILAPATLAQTGTPAQPSPSQPAQPNRGNEGTQPNRNNNNDRNVQPNRNNDRNNQPNRNNDPNNPNRNDPNNPDRNDPNDPNNPNRGNPNQPGGTGADNRTPRTQNPVAPGLTDPNSIPGRNVNPDSTVTPGGVGQGGFGTGGVGGVGGFGNNNSRYFQLGNQTDENRLTDYGRRMQRFETQMQERNTDLLRRLGEARRLPQDRQMSAYGDLLQEILQENQRLHQYLVQGRSAFTGDFGDQNGDGMNGSTGQNGQNGQGATPFTPNNQGTDVNAPPSTRIPGNIPGGVGNPGAPGTTIPATPGNTTRPGNNTRPNNSPNTTPPR